MSTNKLSMLSIAFAMAVIISICATAIVFMAMYPEPKQEQPKEELVVSALQIAITDNTYGLGIVTDEITGCQYIVVNYGHSITPRMHSDGVQYCIDVPQAPIPDDVSLTDAFLQEKYPNFQM